MQRTVLAGKLRVAQAGNYRRPAAYDRHYTLVCSYCGDRQDDDGLILDCRSDHAPALLRTEYSSSHFSPRSDLQGISRYQEWLPTVRLSAAAGRTVVYRSERLAKFLGLSSLWVAFSGYWPARGAFLETATFKELEACTVLGRLPERSPVLTVASSGNTAAAFAWACTQERVPCLLIIPGWALARFKFPAPLDPCVDLVVIDDGEYPDAIDLAARVSRMSSFHAEGGVRNVGRRDGLATVLLSAFEEMGCLPSHYFQAVGSGTGAIAVLEAAKRIRSGAGDMTLPKLMLCQNRAFAPIYDAWRTGLRYRERGFPDSFRGAVSHLYANELTNPNPPYEVIGGVYDSLVESRGEVLTADSTSARKAAELFLELEGTDIEPAAGVAVSCLQNAVARGQLDQESVVLLNITGGGRLGLADDYSLTPAEPRLRLCKSAIATEEAVKRIATLPRMRLM